MKPAYFANTKTFAYNFIKHGVPLKFKNLYVMMKSFSFFPGSKGIFLLLPVLSGLVFSCNHKQEEIRVMTFNIRLDTPADSMNSWKYRRENAARMIRFYDVDLLGTQEVLHNQLQDLLNLLPEYGYIGAGRKDGKTEGEYSALFFRKCRFDLLKTGNFWLSQTPEVPGSMGWDAACERMVTWGIFKDRANGKKFAAFNTHFDHMGKVARLNSALLLKDRISQIAGNMPVILTGDFNDTEGSEPIQKLLEGGKLKDTRRSAALVYGPEWTFHGFGQVPLPERERIDFIFVSPSAEVNACASLAEVCDTLYLSDHNPVLAKVVLP